MRLVDSSDPTEVPRAEALEQLNERLALADAVCAALDGCQGTYADDVASAAMRLLRRWVSARFPKSVDEVEPMVWDGLDDMPVPPGQEDVMVRLRRATAVCSRLAFMYTADHHDDFVGDKNDVSIALDHWRAARPADPTEWRRPFEGGPPITLPHLGTRLNESMLAYVKMQSAEKQAEAWNEILAEHPVYGPRTGLEVGVGGSLITDRHARRGTAGTCRSSRTRVGS